MPSGRPNRRESRQRTARFLTLIAEGHDAYTAARQARIGPWRALQIVTESDFRTIVEAIREGTHEHTADGIPESA